MSMARERLLELLDDGSDVAGRCREALLSDAQFEVDAENVETKQIARLYARRERTAERVGQESIGFPQAVHALEAYTGAYVAIGYVDDRPGGGWFYRIFLDEECSRLIACLGVAAPRAR